MSPSSLVGKKAVDNKLLSANSSDKRLAIIGGSGFYDLGEDFELDTEVSDETPYGPLAANISLGKWHGLPVVFLPRHGRQHKIAPHQINYRANLWALKNLAVSHIISVNAVGGISQNMSPLSLALPDQIIDYTSGREQSFSDSSAGGMVKHIEFAQPYSENLRRIISCAASDSALVLADSGTYACTNGPRLETIAEIKRLQADGCDMVGMTGMPEAALARELDIEYAALALSVNWAAGLSGEAINMDQILATIQQGMLSVKTLLAVSLKALLDNNKR